MLNTRYKKSCSTKTYKMIKSICDDIGLTRNKNYVARQFNKNSVLIYNDFKVWRWYSIFNFNTVEEKEYINAYKKIIKKGNK